MVLLKLVGTFHLALNSHTVTDTGPRDVSCQISSLNMQMNFSFCTSYWCMGISLQLHLFVTYILDSNRWSSAHRPLDPNDIYPVALSKGGLLVPRRPAHKISWIWVARKPCYKLSSIFEQEEENKEKKINIIWSNIQGILIKTCVWDS